MSRTLKYSIVLWFLLINVSFANVIDVDNTQLKKLIKEDVSIVDIRTINEWNHTGVIPNSCLLYTSPSPRDGLLSRMPSSA